MRTRFQERIRIEQSEKKINDPSKKKQRDDEDSKCSFLFCNSKFDVSVRVCRLNQPRTDHMQLTMHDSSIKRTGQEVIATEVFR